MPGEVGRAASRAWPGSPRRPCSSSSPPRTTWSSATAAPAQIYAEATADPGRIARRFVLYRTDRHGSPRWSPTTSRRRPRCRSSTPARGLSGRSRWPRRRSTPSTARASGGWPTSRSTPGSPAGRLDEATDHGELSATSATGATAGRSSADRRRRPLDDPPRGADQRHPGRPSRVLPRSSSPRRRRGPARNGAGA